MPFPPSLLDALLQGWRLQLGSWAQSGQISRAATDALQLAQESDLLQLLVGRWASKKFVDLPRVELLPASSMPGAAGAYALSTGAIYLNQDWLRSASREQALALLTEELGHHLDGLLNDSDTPGDEGELFAAILLKDGAISAGQRQQMLAQNDSGRILVAGQELAVEQAARVVTTPIPQTIPGRTGGEFRNTGAFAAIKADGGIVVWGDSSSGGRFSSDDLDRLRPAVAQGISQIFSGARGFAALTTDGSVVTWGRIAQPSADVASLLTSGVSQVFSSATDWAALKRDGSVVMWNESAATTFGPGVVQIFSNSSALVALKKDGSVIPWGDNVFGWTLSSLNADQLSSGVKQIFSSNSGWAALKRDGSVVTSQQYFSGNQIEVPAQISSGVVQIFSNQWTFAALKKDGSVVQWGNQTQDLIKNELKSGVKRIFSSEGAFAALKTDGSVVTWRTNYYGGGGGNSTSVASQLRSGVSEIFANDHAFAALKTDGSVVTWGDYRSGGDSGLVGLRLRSGVSQIFSTNKAFAALKKDGSVVTWGDFKQGGDSSSVATRLSSGVSYVFTTGAAFAALKTDGSVVTWGDSEQGGDSSSVANQLTDVVAFANPFTDDRLSFETYPTITGISDNVGLTQGQVANGGATDDLTPTITGRLPAALATGETVRLFDGKTLLGSASVNNTALTWIYTPTLPATAGKAYRITARVADAAGDLGTASTARKFVLDTNPPTTTAAIKAVIDNFGLATGSIANGARTDDRTPTITGTLSAALASGETLRIFNGKTLLGSASINNTAKTWSYTPNLPTTAGKAYTITASIADAAGNLGATSNARRFVLDTNLPTTTAAITAVIDNFGLSTGSIANGARTDDRTPTITGTLSAALASGETLRIFNGTNLLGTAAVNKTARTWSFTPALPKPSAAGANYVITARVATAAGNLARASASRSFTLSATPDISISNITYKGIDGKAQPFRMINHNTLLASNRPDGVIRFKASGNGVVSNGLPTYVYAHGWKDSHETYNSNLLFTKLTQFLKSKANVVLVDWSSLAKQWPITLNLATTWLEPLSEASVTKQVGETVADALIRAGVAIDKVTLIGHSLGSFVMAAAANEISIRTGTKAKELVALDTAFGSNEYDIDARNGIRVDKPFRFTADLADTTTSYTASDLIGGIPASAGDNERAATAQNAYLVQYARSTNLPGLAPSQAAALHNGIIGAYADLFAKNILHPRDILINKKPVLNSQNRFDSSGKPSTNGLFDGVIASAQPWAWTLNGSKQEVTIKAPKAIGWTDSYKDPIIYGSNAADIMFFDKFKDEGSSSWLVGRDGNDWLVGGKTDGKGIDMLTGNAGFDKFWFGYQRYGKDHRPYLDKDSNSDYGGTAFAIVTDFNRNQDYLNFIWSKSEITTKTGSDISPSFANLGTGVGFLNNNDLIAYVPGLNLSQVNELIASNRIAFNQKAQLDSLLLA